MLRKLMNNQALVGFVHRLLLVAWLLPVGVTILPKPAAAQYVWYFGKIEDPRLQALVKELKELLIKLWKQLCSFGWLIHPREFYSTLKHLFISWYHLITKLATILLEYIAQIEVQIANSLCANRSCTQMGNPAK